MKRRIYVFATLLLCAFLTIGAQVFSVLADDGSVLDDLSQQAPTPTVKESEIINVFSDHFSNPKGVSLGSAIKGAILSTDKFGATDNFVYVDSMKGGSKAGILFSEAIDVTEYDSIHFDVYPINADLRPRITLADSDGNGSSTSANYAATLGTAPKGQWTSFNLSVSTLVGQLSTKPDITKLKSLWLFDKGGGIRYYLVDNIYFKKTSGATVSDAPTTLYETPSASASSVKAFYSSYYKPVTSFKSADGAGAVEEKSITIDSKSYPMLYVNTGLNSWTNLYFNDAQNLTDYEKLDLDIYNVGGNFSLKVRLSNGTTSVVSSEQLATGWNHVELNLADFAAGDKPADLTAVNSVDLINNGGYARTLYVANIYASGNKNAEDAAFDKLDAVAPTPTTAADSVLNVFSEHYDNPMGVTLGSNVTGRVISTKKFGAADNFVYIENMKGGTTTGIMFNQAIDATSYDSIHIDIYSVTGGTNGLRPRITLADSTGLGGATPQDYAATVGTAPVGKWTSFDLSVRDIVSHMTGTKPNIKALKSIWFFDYGGGARTYFVDNIYFKKTTAKSSDDSGDEDVDTFAPDSAAPSPVHKAEDVLPIFSTHYGQAATISLDNPGSPTCSMDSITVGENKYLRFIGMNWCLMKLTPTLNLDDYDYIHFDVYTLKDPKIVLGFGDGGEHEGRTPWQYLQPGWKSFDIPTSLLKENGADLSQTSIIRMFSATGFAIDRIYIDNFYAYKGSPSGDVITYEVAQSPEPIMPANVVTTIFSDKYDETLNLESGDLKDETTIAFPKVEEGDRVVRVEDLSTGNIKLTTPIDLTGRDTLHVNLYAKFGSGEVTLAFHSEGMTDYVATATQPEKLSASWSYVNIPVSELTKAGVDITKLDGIQINGDGNLYLDNVYAFTTSYFEGLGEEGLISVDWDKAKTAESLPSRDVTMLGVNLASACGGVKHGVLNTNYFYPTMSDLYYFKSVGCRLFRFPFAWERVQHELGGELDTELDVAEMEKVVAECERLGIYVMLDMHNYCRRLVNGTTYKFGQNDSILSADHFADVWKKLAGVFSKYTNIYGYDIMNEPYGLTPGVWKKYAQAAINAIREVDITTPIVIEGESYASSSSWKTTGAKLSKQLTDPSNNIIWEAHCYFDADKSGHYLKGSYDEEVTTANQHINRIKPFVEWLTENKCKGILGEFGVPRNDARWLTMLDEVCSYLKENHVDGTYWVGGNGYSSDVVSVEPLKDFTQERAQMRVLKKYFNGDNEKISTGIEIVTPVNKEVKHNDALYNLAGQRVMPGTKGILIKNGKKIIVR